MKQNKNNINQRLLGYNVLHLCLFTVPVGYVSLWGRLKRDDWGRAMIHISSFLGRDAPFGIYAPILIQSCCADNGFWYLGLFKFELLSNSEWECCCNWNNYKSILTYNSYIIAFTRAYFLLIYIYIYIYIYYNNKIGMHSISIMEMHKQQNWTHVNNSLICLDNYHTQVYYQSPVKSLVKRAYHLNVTQIWWQRVHDIGSTGRTFF